MCCCFVSRRDTRRASHHNCDLLDRRKVCREQCTRIRAFLGLLVLNPCFAYQVLLAVNSKICMHVWIHMICLECSSGSPCRGLQGVSSDITRLREIASLHGTPDSCFFNKSWNANDTNATRSRPCNCTSGGLEPFLPDLSPCIETIGQTSGDCKAFF